MTIGEPRATGPRARPGPLQWALCFAVLVLGAAIVHIERRVTALTEQAVALSGAAQVQLLTPATLLLANTRGDAGYSLEQLNHTRSTSHAWLDGFIQQQGISEGDATLLRALHDRFLGQRAEARINGAVGIYQPQDVAQLHQALRERYAQAATAVLGEPTAATLMQGIDAQLLGWEPPR